MTVAGRWMTIAGLLGATLGLARGQTGLAVLSLTVLVWLMAEWLWFSWRLWRHCGQLQFERSVNGRSEDFSTLQAGRLITVEVRLTMRKGRMSPPIRIRDSIPENATVVNNGHQVRILSNFQRTVFRYEARICGAGQIRLPGFRLVIEDAQGLFRAERFVPCPQVFRVLPAWVEAGEHRPLIKRSNALPQHGIHRLQRAGMGGELLELREYVAGDPPKSIAWKVSARRDRLMTRQYESEVPIRLQLFVDGSISTRIGGFGERLLDQITYVAASVARSAISSGDLVGLTTFDERGMQRRTPVAGERGFLRILQDLADFSVNPAPLPDRLTPLLQQTAMTVCREQFPELLDARYNRVPAFWAPWLPWRRRHFYERCQLAGILSHLYAMPPLRHVQLIEDDALLATFTQHFLSQQGLAWLTPVVSIRGRGFHDGVARLELLADSIRNAVAHARDNELFVICSDLLENTHSISHLMPALRLARARHHRVAVVCPTPSFRRPSRASVEIVSDAPEDLLLVAEQMRCRELAEQLQGALRQAGVSITFSGEQQAIRMILTELDLARTGRTSAGRGSSL
jgi:uncharacterized protein (DUF58 family)